MSDWKVELVTDTGEADYSVTVVGDQVVDLTGATDGQVLTVQNDGTVAPENPGTPGAHASTHNDGGSDEILIAKSQISGVLPGTALARAASVVSDTITTVEADLTGLTVTFDSPADRDVWVIGRVKSVSAVTASATVTIKLTDGANVQKDTNLMRSGTASRNYVELSVDEIIPAGSGTGLVRKLRGVSTTADGFTNLLGLSRSTLDVIVR